MERKITIRPEDIDNNEPPHCGECRHFGKCTFDTNGYCYWEAIKEVRKFKPGAKK